jgi:hypothetical protein
MMVKHLSATIFFIVLTISLGLSAGQVRASQPANGSDSAPAGPLPGVAPAASADVFFNDWTFGGGMLYLADRCIGGEFRAPSNLYSQPAYGGWERPLETTPMDRCVTYRGMAADDTGLYYASGDTLEIKRRAKDLPPGAEATTVMTGTYAWTDLKLDDTSLYFGTATQIVRVAKAGGTPTVIADTSTGVRDVVLYNNFIYWLEDGGIWRELKNCASRPCAKELITTAAAGGEFLHLEPTQSGEPNLYWVRHTIPDIIQRYNCLASCFTETIYTAPTDQQWYIGRPVSSGGLLFWPESYYVDTTNYDGRLRRRGIDGSVADIVVNIYPDERLSTNAQQLFYVTFGPGTSRTNWVNLDAAAIQREFAVDGWEVTQGIQNLDNGVPLVADKPTYVRLYGRRISGLSANFVEAALHGWRDGNPLPGSPLRPLKATSALLSGYDRGDAAAGWLFRLPRSWTASGTTLLQGQIDPRGTYHDNTADNTLTKSFSFTRKAPVCLMFVPVRTEAPAVSVQHPYFWEMLDLAKRLWPTAAIWPYYQDEDIAELGFFSYNPYEVSEDGWKILLALSTRDSFTDDPDACDNLGARTHYVGMVHPSANTAITTPRGMFTAAGLGYVGRNALWVKFPPFNKPSNASPWQWPWAGVSLAHELGHNAGRKHVNCGNPDDPDDQYPYPPCQLDDVSPTAHYGFDINSRLPITPTVATMASGAIGDLMSYAGRRWTSDYTWKELFKYLGSPARAATAPAGVASAAAATPGGPGLAAATTVLVTGAITPSLNQGSLEYAWAYPTALLSQGMQAKWQALAAPDRLSRQARAEPISGTYHLQLLSATNAVLGEHLVTPFDPHTDEGSDVRTFIVTFPDPGGVARLRLIDGATVLASRAVGLQAPSVTVTAPGNGATISDSLTVRWQVADADSGDRLLYTVQYSPDSGQSWQALATNFPGPSGSANVELALPTVLGLPGTAAGSNSLIRVAASDGYHTTIATSAPFQVNQRSPHPTISSPSESTWVVAGEPVTLRGGAWDAEDGVVDDDSLSWAVDLEFAGLGPELELLGLAPGRHALMLTAEDSQGSVRTASAPLNIAMLQVPLRPAPTLDGSCDDAAYPLSSDLGLAYYPANDSQATAHLARTATDLWVCFTGLSRNANGPGASVGLHVDVNNSRDALAQADDLGLLIGEDGLLTSMVGDSAGGYAGAGPSGLQGQVTGDGLVWSAELRIPAAALGGWNHIVGLDFVHANVGLSGSDYHWPYSARNAQPDTWARTVLGNSCSDIDANGMVNLLDIQTVAAQWNTATPLFPFDQESDGDVDVADIMRIGGRFGQGGCG